MGFWIKDIRQAARRLAKSRSFFLTVVLMLALGIGATTTVFSLIQGILLRPLPFRDPGRLVQLGEHVGENPGIGITARRHPSLFDGRPKLSHPWAHSPEPALHSLAVLPLKIFLRRA